MIMLIRWKGECPMARVKVRKVHRCHGCAARIPKGAEAFRSLLNGEAGGLQRYDLICAQCGEACPHKLES